MLDGIELMCGIATLVAAGTPLLYAIATLNGLQHKTVYPLFRVIKHNGHLSATEAPSREGRSTMRPA